MSAYQGVPVPSVVAAAAKPPKPPKGPKAPKAPKGTRGMHIPNPLAPLSQSQIIKQATSTIGKAYAASFGDLNTQEARSKALQAKRSADNQYYQQWLDSKMAELQARNDQANATLKSSLDAATAAQNALFAHQGADMVNAADSRQGNVSNNANATEFGPTLAANQAYATGLTGAANTQALTDMTTGNNQVAASRANSQAYLMANERIQESNFSTLMQKIADARTKLNLGKAADIQKEIARLQGIEIQKAESTRAYNAAATKLGLAGATLNERIRNDTTNQRLKANSQQIQLRGQDLAQMRSDRQYQLDQQKFGAAQARDLYERKHGLGPYKTGRGTGVTAGMTAAELRAQDHAFSQVDRLIGELDRLKALGYTGQQAYHYLQRGGKVASGRTRGTNGTTNVAYTTYSAYGDAQLLNAAYNVSGYGNGLTQGDVNALRQRGYRPRARYRFAHGVR